MTVVSSAKISGARSTKRRFQSPTEFGCTPYAFATWPGVLSPASTSSTTCAFSFGVYLRLAMSTSFASARSYPEQRRSRRSTPQCWGVQDSGVISHILYWSNEDQVFVAEAPELPGCMAHGDDQKTALGNIKDAMQCWIDRARELGRPVPEPKGERLMLA